MVTDKSAVISMIFKPPPPGTVRKVSGAEHCDSIPRFVCCLSLVAPDLSSHHLGTGVKKHVRSIEAGDTYQVRKLVEESGHH